MPSDVTVEPHQRVRRRGFDESVIERQALKLDAGAPVTEAVSTGNYVVAGFGDGTVRFFHPGLAPVTVEAHRGVVLSMAADCEPGFVLTGGDDGRFLRLSPQGVIQELANFGTRWVDCVASGPNLRACSSGRVAHIWQPGDTDARTFEHPSTVGGLAFDAKGKRLAVGHYGGATVWERVEKRWKPKRLFWKGSHGAISFSPDGKFVVTSKDICVMGGNLEFSGIWSFVLVR